MGIFKTAMKASVATRVAGNVHRKQQSRWAAEDQRAQQAPAPVAPVAPPVAPPAPPQQPPAQQPQAGQGDMLAQLTQLGQLRDSGVLNITEFETAKARILAGN